MIYVRPPSAPVRVGVRRKWNPSRGAAAGAAVCGTCAWTCACACTCACTCCGNNRFFCKHANETACAASDYLFRSWRKNLLAAFCSALNINNAREKREWTGPRSAQARLAGRRHRPSCEQLGASRQAWLAACWGVVFVCVMYSLSTQCIVSGRAR